MVLSMVAQPTPAAGGVQLDGSSRLDLEKWLQMCTSRPRSPTSQRFHMVAGKAEIVADFDRP
jgi:hypothetical protein